MSRSVIKELNDGIRNSKKRHNRKINENEFAPAQLERVINFALIENDLNCFVDSCDGKYVTIVARGGEKIDQDALDNVMLEYGYEFSEIQHSSTHKYFFYTKSVDVRESVSYARRRRMNEASIVATRQRSQDLMNFSRRKDVTLKDEATEFIWKVRSAENATQHLGDCLTFVRALQIPDATAQRLPANRQSYVDRCNALAEEVEDQLNDAMPKLREIFELIGDIY